MKKVEVARTQSVVHDTFWVDHRDARVAGCESEARGLAVAFGVARIGALADGEGDDESVVEELYAE